MSGKAYFFFADGNTAKGYRHFFDSTLKLAEKIIVLDTPLKTFSTELLHRFAESMIFEDKTAEIMNCSLDSTFIDAVYIPEYKLAVVSQEVDSLIHSDKKEKISLAIKDKKTGEENQIVEMKQQIDQLLQKAYATFAEALSIHDEWEKIYIANMDFEKMDCYTKSVIDLVLHNKKIEKSEQPAESKQDSNGMDTQQDSQIDTQSDEVEKETVNAEEVVEEPVAADSGEVVKEPVASDVEEAVEGPVAADIEEEVKGSVAADAEESIKGSVATEAEEAVKEVVAVGEAVDVPKGQVFDRFLGAATPYGPVDYINNLTGDLNKRYFIKGRPGTGKSTMLKKIIAEALNAGIDCEVYHCGFDPDSLDMVIMRKLGVAVFDSTSPHEYFPVLETDEILDVYEEAVKQGTDEFYKPELDDIITRYRGKVLEATKILFDAKTLNDKIESIGNKPVNSKIIHKSETKLKKKVKKYMKKQSKK